MRPDRRKLLKSLTGGLLMSSQLRPGLAFGGESTPVLPASGGDVVWLAQDDARALQDAYNLRTMLPPRYRALCMTEDGARLALSWALDNAVPFSIRSGGHCFEGFSQSADLVIDLRHMRRVEVGDDGRLNVQPGANLGQINNATAPSGRVLPAGFCQGVGIGGHVGGGGLGLLSRAHGLTCDRLVSARVLTANGIIVQASNTEDADLFWALRGGGSGAFGVVLAFTFELASVPDAALAEIDWLLDPDRAAELAAHWQNTALELDRDISAFLFIQSRRSGGLHVRTRLAAASADRGLDAIVQGLTDIVPPLVEPSIIGGRFLDVANRLWPQTYNPKEYAKFTSNFLEGGLPASGWLETLTALDAAQSDGHAIIMERLGGAIDDIAPDATAYVHRGAPDFLTQFQVTAPTSEGFADRMETMREIHDTLSGKVLPGAYVNYPDLDLRDWQVAYWGDNYQRLTRIKQTYDPGDIFHHAQSVRPSG
jgi:FAD/FMN-containing dehydrogenase